ncbi:MAG: gliding motility-associated C-terminal domain-containing protein [Bacteroidota bacterium]
MNYCPPCSKPFLLLCWGLLSMSAWTARAQVLPTPGEYHYDAPIITCLDGYTGTQIPESYSITFPGFCGDLQNAQWLAFIAEQPDMVLSCEVFNCIGAANGGFGIQLGVLGVGNGCQPSDFYGIACDGSGNWSQQDFNLTNLEVGRIYYVVVDGYAGDFCSFSLSLDSPQQGPQAPDPSLTGPLYVQAGSVAAYDLELGIEPYINHNPCDNEFTACDGSTCDYAFNYVWSVPAGSSALSLPGEEDALVTWGNVGGQVCVTVENPCLAPVQVCLDVVVVDLSPDPCALGDPTPPGATCADAPFLCGAALQSFCGDNTGAPADIPGNLNSVVGCSVENNHWLRFSPCDTTVHLAVALQNASFTAGLEVSVLQSDDCQNFQSLLDCQLVAGPVPVSFGVLGLVPGEVYYLMLDGLLGQGFNYQISVLDGISTAAPEFVETSPGSISGPSEVCPEEEPIFTLSPPSCMPVFADGCPFPDALAADLRIVWHLPPTMRFIGDSVDVFSIQVAIEDTTDGFISVTYETRDADGVYCAFDIGDCGQVTPHALRVNYNITHLPDAYICEDETFLFCGQSYDQSQLLVCPEYCGETQQELIVLPLDTIFAPIVQLCAGDTYDFCGQTFPGNQSATWYCRSDCQITAQEFIVHPKVVNDFGVALFCPGDCYEFQGQQFCTEGVHEVELPGAFGCDETYRILLQYYYPPILQASTVLTDCEVNSNAYQVSFELLNGVPPYYVNGQVLASNRFTSAWLDNNIPYDFEIRDSDLCPATSRIQGSFDCTTLCTTDAGTLQALQLSACGDESIQVALGSNTIIDPNDTYHFILHDGTASSLSTELRRNATGSFNFDPATMQHGQNYYVNLLVGNDNGGQVDTDDACLSLGEGLPVVFYEVPLAQAEVTGILTCYEPSATLSAGLPIGGATYAWEGPGGFSSNQVSFPTATAGTYRLVVTSADGCVVRSEILVEERNDPPTLEAGTADELNCTNWVVELAGEVVLETGSIDYEWRTDVGNFVEGEARLNPVVDAPGWYYLYAIDRDNGCAALDSVYVNFNDKQPDSLVLDVRQPNCFGENSGGLTVLEVIGGTEPYLYTLDEEAWSQTTAFAQLGPGTYDLRIQDANGCELSWPVALQSPPELEVELGDDRFPTLGEELTLVARPNFAVDSVSWTNGSGEVLMTSADRESVEAALAYPFVALENAVLHLELFAADGCSVSDQLRIFVDRREEVFIPNVFSPNGDGENDYFTVFAGPSVLAVDRMLIYSRWGDVVYQGLGLSTNTASEGWNGTLAGEELNDGVFIYQIDLRLVNGETRRYTGDVLLMK